MEAAGTDLNAESGTMADSEGYEVQLASDIPTLTDQDTPMYDSAVSQIEQLQTSRDAGTAGGSELGGSELEDSRNETRDAGTAGGSEDSENEAKHRKRSLEEDEPSRKPSREGPEPNVSADKVRIVKFAAASELREKLDARDKTIGELGERLIQQRSTQVILEERVHTQSAEIQKLHQVLSEKNTLLDDQAVRIASLESDKQILRDKISSQDESIQSLTELSQKVNQLERKTKELETERDNHAQEEQEKYSKMNNELDASRADAQRLKESEANIRMTLSDLEQTHRNLQITAQASESQNDTDQAELKRLQDLVDALNQEGDEHRENLERIKEEAVSTNDADQAELKRLQDLVDALNQEGDEQRERLERMGQEASSRTSRTVELEQELEMLKQTKTNLEVEQNKLQAAASSLQSQLDVDRRKLKELQDIESASAETMSEIGELRAKLKCAQDEARRTQAQLDDSTTAFNKLQDETMTLKENVQRVIDLENQLKEFESSIADLEQKNRTLEMTALTSESQSDDAETLRVLQQENSSHLEELTKLRASIETLKEADRVQKAAAAQLRTSNENLEKERKRLDALVSKHKSNSRENTDHQEQIKAKEKMISELNQSLQDLRRTTVAKPRFDTLTTDYKDLQAKFGANVSQLTKLQKQQSSCATHVSRITELQETLTNVRNELKQEAESRSREQQQATSQTQADAQSIQALHAQISELKSERDKHQDSAARLRSQLEQETGSTNAKQSMIESLQQEVESLKQERDALKTDPRPEAADIELLKEEIETLKSERDELKEDLCAQTAGSTFIFATRGKGHPMSRAKVNAELCYSKKQFPSYKLGAPLRSQSAEPGTGPSSLTNPEERFRPTPRAPWTNTRDSPYVKRSKFLSSSGSDTEAETSRSKRKRKSRAVSPSSSFGSDSSDTETDAMSEEESSLSDDEPVESNVSHTAARYRRKGTRKTWTREEQKKQINKLGRHIVREALGVRRNFKGFVRASVSDDRLAEFVADPSQNGPKVRNTWIDKRAATTKDLAALPWNEQLLVNMTKTANAIVAEARDKRFGKKTIKWVKLFTERLYRIFLDVVKALPQTVNNIPETTEQVHNRLIASYEVKIKKNGETSIRHVKWHTRSEICTIMIQSCDERKDIDGVHLFQYILRVLAKLKPTGMSEDEDGVDTVVNSAGVTIDEPVKFTMILPFRNAYFNDVVDFVDHLPGFERLLFIQSGRVKKRRVRGDPRCQTSKRKAPMHWPRSFFSPEYLNGMSELQRMKHVGKNDVDLWEIDFTSHKDRFKKS